MAGSSIKVIGNVKYSYKGEHIADLFVSESAAGHRMELTTPFMIVSLSEAQVDLLEEAITEFRRYS